VPDRAVICRPPAPYQDYWAVLLWDAASGALPWPDDDYWHDGAGTTQNWHTGDEPWDGLSERSITVVLTIAHLVNMDPQACEPSNLAALCQLHHLRLDAQLHGRRAAVTRRAKRGQLTLLEVADAPGDV
jgi:hypothetical protein